MPKAVEAHTLTPRRKSVTKVTPNVSGVSGPLKGRVRLNPAHFPDGPDPAAYATTIDGDCMAPEIRSGDMAIVSPAAPIEVGELVVLWWADARRRPWVKRLYMAPRVPVGTPVHPESEVVDAVVVQMLNPPRIAAIEITKLKAMHRVVGVYREEDLPGLRVAAG